MRQSRNTNSETPKRGPGRPRIHPLTENAPKRRGRPPGSKNKTQEPREKRKYTRRVDMDAAPKRRGRPPGSKNRNQREQAPAKRRGRPPGSKDTHPRSTVRTQEVALLTDILSLVARIDSRMGGNNPAEHLNTDKEAEHAPTAANPPPADAKAETATIRREHTPRSRKARDPVHAVSTAPVADQSENKEPVLVH